MNCLLTGLRSQQETWFFEVEAAQAVLGSCVEPLSQTWGRKYALP